MLSFLMLSIIEKIVLEVCIEHKEWKITESSTWRRGKYRMKHLKKIFVFTIFSCLQDLV